MDSFKEIWNAVLTYCEERVTETAFNLWIKKTEFVSFEAATITLRLPSAMYMDVVISQYGTMFSEAFAAIMGFEVKIKYICAEDNDREEHKFYQDKQHLEDYKNEQYTFENFIVGSSNRFAYVAAKAVASDPGLNLTQNSKMRNYNPLFIYGSSGLGKTHLLHAIGNYIREFEPNLKIKYVTCEQFTNDYISSLYSSTKNKAIIEFREKYRNLDVLMVDDIQFISNKKETQEEFFHTFNEMTLSNKQVIICSDRPPKEIATLEDRLRTRFASGLIHDIQKPDIETRIAILHKKSQLEKYYAEDEVINYIAEHIDTNIRELEGKLSEVYFLATLSGKKIATMDEVKDIFSNQKEELKNDLTPDKIISVVCDYFNISYQDIIGKKKNKEIVEPRMIAIYLISELLNLPLVNIGKIFGGRDHTTIMHSRDKISQDLKVNKKTQTLVNEIKNSLTLS